MGTQPDRIWEDLDITKVLDGYDFATDGTVALVSDGIVLHSNNPTLALDDSQDGDVNYETIHSVADNHTIERTLYDDGTGRLQLGYLCAEQAGDELYLVMEVPASMVFKARQKTVLWASLCFFVLLAMVYVVGDRLLLQIVVRPIAGTNESLGKITDVDLDEVVSEVDSVEFSTLSAGINTTVDSLKRLNAEAKRRLEQDLSTARAIQEGALPRQYPAFADVSVIDLYALMNAAREVGGDFYDFYAVDDHTVCFLIADVSGKGIPGALFMMSAKTEIQSHLSAGEEPAQAIAAANAYLCSHNEAQMFVTVWAVTLDWQTGLLTYVNAGHNYPLLRHGRDGTWEWINKKCGLFLGAFETAKYRQREIVLKPGDELVLYTDGVNEAFNVDEEEYGNDRLEAFLVAHSDERPRDLVKALRDDVADWAKGAEQSDDITILAMEYDA